MRYDDLVKFSLQAPGSIPHFAVVPIIILIAAIVIAFIGGGWGQAFLVSVLVILEVSLSFDNAVINATVLRRMNEFWQKMFLTVGIVVAVVGMRLLFPVAIVVATAGLSYGTVVDLILNHPAEYAEKLHAAHPAIAAFGGAFLLMIFLDFLLDEAKKVHWLNFIEQPLAEGGRLKTMSTMITLVALIWVSSTWAGEDSSRVLFAGVVGLLTYLTVRGFSQLFERIGTRDHGTKQADGKIVKMAGKAAFFLFLYLEVLDASFSFDGVIGAFAITSNVLTIALGLGVGAFFVRELTIWLVRHDTLSEFVYLEHGAHYAIGALAVLLAVSLRYDTPDIVTGLVGVGFIAASLVSSLRHRSAVIKHTRAVSR